MRSRWRWTRRLDLCRQPGELGHRDIQAALRNRRREITAIEVITGAEPLEIDIVSKDDAMAALGLEGEDPGMKDPRALPFD